MKDMGKLRWALGLCAVLGVAALGVACDDDEGSDSPDAAVDTGVKDTASDTTTPLDGKSVDFGTVCSNTTECGGATNYCAKSPLTAAKGQCSYIGCNLKPGVCPAVEPCTDVGLYVPGIPMNTFLCVNPERLKPADGGTDAGGDASTDAQKD